MNSFFLFKNGCKTDQDIFLLLSYLKLFPMSFQGLVLIPKSLEIYVTYVYQLKLSWLVQTDYNGNIFVLWLNEHKFHSEVGF